MDFDTLIYNGIIVTVNPDFDIIENGWLGIRDRNIAGIGQTADRAIPAARSSVDAKGGIVLPGLINTHTHLPMTLFRGLADDLPLMEWLNDHIFPAEANQINETSARIGALMGCVEMLSSGTTTCCDGYFHEASVAQAILESGMRGVAAQGVIDFPAPGVPDPAKNIDAAVAYAAQFQDASPRLYPSIFATHPTPVQKKPWSKQKMLQDDTTCCFKSMLPKPGLSGIKSSPNTTCLQSGIWRTWGCWTTRPC